MNPHFQAVLQRRQARNETEYRAVCQTEEILWQEKEAAKGVETEALRSAIERVRRLSSALFRRRLNLRMAFTNLLIAGGAP